MSTPPTTQPETWVPAGTEKPSTGTMPPSETAETRRKPHVPLPPPQPRTRSPRIRRLRSWATNLSWAAVAAAVPWAWFLVRDLGTAMQVVALALPVLIVAAFVGLAISALDERKVSSLLVAVSVAAFGWVTIFGPRSALPASPPVDPVRITSMTVDGTDMSGGDIVDAFVERRADVAIAVGATKKARKILLNSNRYPFTFATGRFVVLSSDPVTELPLAKGLDDDLIIRLQVAGATGSFIVYAVRTDDSPLDAALNEPIDVELLRDAALDERLPVVLAGDFGLSDRSTGYRVLVDTFRDAMRSGTGASSTAAAFPWNLVFARTAFVLTSPDWCSGPGITFDVPDAQTDGLAAAVGPCRV